MSIMPCLWEGLENNWLYSDNPIKVVALIIPCYSISKSICNSCSYNIRHVMVSPTEVMLMCTQIILICSFKMKTRKKGCFVSEQFAAC